MMPANAPAKPPERAMAAGQEGGDTRHRHLPDDVHELQRRIGELEDALAAGNRQLEQFTHGISHDLRAPLRAIDSFASVLQGELGDDAPAAARDHLERIRAASARAGSLIDALLELSRAGRNPLQRQPVDLSLLADWVLVELQDADQGRTAQVEVQSGLSVSGDERALKQMLRQVLHNAWKFSTDPVRIQVSGERVGDTVQLQVRDSGSGFDMQYTDKLFEPFQRLHGADAGGGHGIGLAIAQRIIERHGGRIHARSTPGEGSVFHIELPAAGEEQPSGKQA